MSLQTTNKKFFKVPVNWTERKITMALNKKSLGTTLLQLEKGTNEEVQNAKLNQFAVVHNNADDTDMICFTVKEIPEKYFWASASLFTFLAENIENAEYDDDAIAYSFPEDEVRITHAGKTPLKSDKNKSVNVWKIIC